jgi:hypothetical protein
VDKAYVIATRRAGRRAAAFSDEALPPPLPHVASPTLLARALSALMAGRKTGIRQRGSRYGEGPGGSGH